MKLHTENLSFAYGGNPVLQDISLSFTEGELIAVLGANGAGKSTLFRCILGLLRPDGGHVYLDDELVDSIPASQLSRKMAYVPQSHTPTFNYSVLDVVLMGTTAHIRGLAAPGEEERMLAMACLERLGIAELSGRGYLQISGGERQLVLIARALAQQAPLLVMDEPTANLDYGNQFMVLSHIQKLAGEGYTILQSTHSPDQAFRFADRVIALSGGAVAAYGPPAEVLTEEMILQLYGIEATVYHVPNTNAAVCLPIQIADSKMQDR